MPLNANCIWEVRTDGNDDNGGAFRSGAAGTDYSQQAASQKNGTDLTMHPSTNTRVQPVAAGVAAADVGNVVNITAGTGWTTGWYEITAQDGTYWTLDRSPAAAGSANTGTYRMGGALASPGRLGQALASSNSGVSGMKCYIKSGTYTITSTTANVSGGLVSLPSQIMLLVEGYNSTRGDLGTPPEINAGTQTSFIIFTSNGYYSNRQQFIINIKVNGNNKTGVVGINSNNAYRDKLFRCVAVNCPGNGIVGTFDAAECVASSCAIGFSAGGTSTITGCVSYSNTSHGFGGGSSATTFINCLTYSNSGDGFNVGNYQQTFINCTSHNNSGDGFDFGNYGMNAAINCLATNNGGWGFNLPYTDNFMLNCGGRNNTSGNVDTSPSPLINPRFVTLTADPYQNAAGSDFRLNSTSGGGTALKGQGAAIQGQTDYRDIGAVQTTPGSGGGGFRPVNIRGGADQ
jgi:hypothetical protein